MSNAKEYDLAKAIPNKFLNPDGTISTLQDILKDKSSQNNTQNNGE